MLFVQDCCVRCKMFDHIFLHVHYFTGRHAIEVHLLISKWYLPQVLRGYYTNHTCERNNHDIICQKETSQYECLKS